MSTVPPLNEPSFRLAMESQIASLPPEHQTVVHSQMNAITDVYQAFTALNTKVNSIKTSAATAASSSSATSSSSTTGVTAPQAASIATAAIQTTLGGVDRQSVTAYTALNSDYGGIITIDNASPVAITLGGDGSGIGPQWFSFWENIGSGVATLTPANSATINGHPSIQLVQNQGAVVFYDGAEWFALTSVPGSGGTITDVIAGTGLTGGGSSGSVTLSLATPVSVADGGTGTPTPGLVGGPGISVTGTWPDQTVTATGSGGYLKGSVSINISGGAGTYLGNTTIAGASGGMAVVMCAPPTSPNAGLPAEFIDLYADIDPTSNVIYCSINYIGGGSGLGSISFPLVVFP